MYISYVTFILNNLYQRVRLQCITYSFQRLRFEYTVIRFLAAAWTFSNSYDRASLLFCNLVVSFVTHISCASNQNHSSRTLPSL